MENEVKISILVPIYKVEQYLERCIDSVLSQSFHDFELILVDDGSPDNCPQICDRYARVDRRIKVIHKKNGGLVSARLAGFEKARGDYLLFLDSDDYLMPDALSSLYEVAKDGYDIVKGNDLRFCDEGQLGIEKPKMLGVEIKGAENYLRSYMSGGFLPYLWGGLYRRSLFTASIFENILDISIYEDGVTNMAIWRGVNRYIAIDKTVCAYYINQKSMMQGTVLSHDYHNRITQLMLDYTKDLDNSYIMRLIHADRMAGHLRCFFMPELKWNQRFYDSLRIFISDANNNRELRKKVEPKFLRFVECQPLFWLYTQLYKKLFKIFKLKNIKRKVL